MGYVGKSINRVDAYDMIRGKAKYIDDLTFPDMLFGITVRSTRQRARIVEIKIPELPEDVVTFTADEIPGDNYVALFKEDQPFLANGIVQYIGEPVLLLAGPDKNILREAEEKIEIRYEDIPAINTIEEALSGKLSPIYGGENIYKKYGYVKGNPDSIFKSKVKSIKYKVFSGTYKTGYQEHIYLENQGMIAIPQGKGVKILGSMQCPFYIRRALAIGLGTDQGDVVIEQVVTGGAFGGKEEFPSLIAGHAAFLALKTGKPVKMVYDRKEDLLVTTKRHPSKTIQRIAFDSDNRIVALDTDFSLDGGAHSTLSEVVLARGALAATGVYRCKNSKLSSRVVSTNNVPSGAFRGFGAPQAFFAIEQSINHSAYRLGINPYDLRKINILRKGDRTTTGQLLSESIGLEKVLDAVEKATDFRKKYKSYKNIKSSGEPLKGIGISSFFHGIGFTGKGEEIIKATATVEYSIKYGAVIKISTVEMGQGMNTVIRQIGADSLQLPISEVHITAPDTSRVPNSGPTVASRTTTIVGGLVYQCCIESREKVNAKDFSSDFSSLVRENLGEGEVISSTKSYKIPKDIHWDDDNFIGSAYPTYSWAAAVVELEVDPITFEVSVEKITAANDIGKAINPILVEGQIEGGSLQGLGYASMEVMTMTNGKINNPNLTDYIIPTSLDVPEIDSIIVEEKYSRGPFGAKGVGEQPLVGVPPAYIGAVENALGVEFFEIPLTPEIIYHKLKDTNRRGR